MAKLKIFKDNNPSANPPIPSKEGYANVGRGVVADFANFDQAREQDRPAMLQRYADTEANGTYQAGAHIIYQLTRGSSPTNEAIDNNNCRVKIIPDERKGNGNAHGKHNIVLPKREADDSALSTGYLAGYVKAIAELYGTGTNTEVTNACNFLFGIMLLTRCR